MRELTHDAYRFVNSFDENVVTKLFTERRDRIKAIEQRMQRTVQQAFRQNMEQMRRQQNEMKQSLDMMVQDQGMRLGEIFYTLLNQTDFYHMPGKNRSPHQVAGPVVPESLPAASVTRPEAAVLGSAPPLDRQDRQVISNHHRTGDDVHAIVPEEIEVSNGCYNRQSILELLGPVLEGFREDTRRIGDITSRALNLTVDSEVKRRIDDWIVDPLGKTIWIQGPHDVARGSQNTLTAACLIALSGQSSIPSIFYFCSLKAPPYSASSCLSCKEVLSDMIKSLTVQLLLLAPENIITELDLSSSRLAQLLDPNLGAEAALQIFIDVRTLAPPYLHCMVEGAQELEDRADPRHTGVLFRALHELTDFPTSRTAWRASPMRLSETGEEKLARVTKVCFFTDGYMDALAALASLDRLEKVEYAGEAHEPGAEEGSRLMSSWDDEL